MLKACVDIARVREDLAEIINLAIEELVRQRYELPGFSTLFRGREPLDRPSTADTVPVLHAPLIRRPRNESTSYLIASPMAAALGGISSRVNHDSRQFRRSNALWRR